MALDDLKSKKASTLKNFDNNPRPFNISEMM